MNVAKTWLLMGLLSALLVMGGSMIGGSSGAIVAMLLSIAMNLAGYWFSARLALSMAGAVPLTQEEAPELYAMTRRLCQRADLPVPKLYLIPAEQPNAFATGRNPENGVVAVTEGLLKLMETHEVEGVIAHELAHIKHRDILIGSMAATFAGAVTMLANWAQWAMIFGGGARQDDDEEESGGSFAGSLVMIIVAPLAAALIQMAISRSREYLADAAAARYAATPNGLIGALEKLSWATRAVPMPVNAATAHMYIAHPLSGGGIMSLFATHPPLEERIRRLRVQADIDSQSA